MKINVYLLKEYRDDYAYGEESIADDSESNRWQRDQH